MSLSMSPARILVLTNVLAPYRREFYQRLSSLSQWEVHVWFCGHHRLSRKWPWTPSTGIRGRELPRVFLGRYALNPTLGFAIRRLSPQLIVASGVSPATLIARHYAVSRRLPLMIWWGGTAESEVGVAPWQQRLRQRVFAEAAGFFSYSALATEYLRRHAGVTQPIFTLGNNTMDARAWHHRVIQARPPRPPPNPIILCIGQLILRKGYDLALRAVAPLASTMSFELVLAGEGPESARLQELARQLGIRERIRFTNHLSHAETIPLYASASVFFHPARLDQWPQVLNEALAAGLPVLLSASSGVPPDFVSDDHNGFVRSAEDVLGWTQCLQELLSKPETRARLAANALATAISRDVNFALAEFCRGVQQVLSE